MSTPTARPRAASFVSSFASSPIRDDALAAITGDADKPRALPEGIETEHDAAILDQIENSLREMIVAAKEPGSVVPSEESPAFRLADVSALTEKQIAQQRVERGFGFEQPHLDPMAPASEQAAERVPPWLVTRSRETDTAPEPWPHQAAMIGVVKRFGLAASGAAVLAVAIVQDIPALAYHTLRTSFATLSSNAAAVFDEGKPSSLRTRMETTAKDQDQVASARVAPASDGMAPPRAEPVKSDVLPMPAQSRMETAASSWSTPGTEKTGRFEPAMWHGPINREQSEEPAAVTRRSLTSEEIDMLRKQGDDYIATGDFAGARVVLQRAAEAGNASAALALAATYDPAVLARFKVRGLVPDAAIARMWYERARALGSPEAPTRLQTLASGQ